MNSSKEPAETFNPNVVSNDRPSISVHEDENNKLQVQMQGDFSRLLNEDIGAQVALGLVGQMASLGNHGRRVDEKVSNFALDYLNTMKPRDSAEALLLTQMAAVHHAVLMMARRLNHMETVPQQDAAERALNKLARTYSTQMDTLKRYRRNGLQTVRVERVVVADGGQAVVGNLSVEGRGGGKS